MSSPPEASSAPADEFVVRSDNGPLVRRFRLILVLLGTLTVLFLVAAGLVAMSDVAGIRFLVWMLLILALGNVLQLVAQAYVWGGRLAITRPLVVGSRGIEAHTQQGSVVLPWPAVTGIERTRRLGQPMMVIRVHPEAVPGEHGVEADLRAWRGFTTRGLHLAELGLRPGFDAILPAIHHYSLGRVPIT